MRKSVLVVDDQEDVRMLLRYVLDSLDIKLYEAEDSENALKMFQEHSPDMVLLDVMLPGAMDGYEICSQIKNNKAPGHDSYVIMLTACGQEADKEKGESVGADKYLVKPFSPMELHKIIHSVL